MTTRTDSILIRLFAAGTLACAASGVALMACASDEPPATIDPDGVDASSTADATADGDAGPAPCTEGECVYFPAECTPDVFCPNGPFDPTDPRVGMDWRTRINAVGGRGASDVWIAGAIGSVAHFDGTSWTRSDVGTQESQRALWLPASGEVVLGSLQRIYTRGIAVEDGGAPSAGGWSVRAIKEPSGYGASLTAAWAAPGADTLWLATATDLWRLRLSGGAGFESVPGIPRSVCDAIQCGQLLAIHGASAGTLWAVGNEGRTIRITDAEGAAPSATPFNSGTWVGLSGVWAASDTDVWAVGGRGTIRHYSGDAVRWDVASGVPTTEDLNGIWGTSPTDIWAVGNAGVVLHYDGASWSRVKVAGLGERRPDLVAVWSPAPNHVWIGGHGIVLALGGRP